ncbi:MAG: hypothetical protein GWP10_01100 [Nitrospiraceae bacterium]|nr:hypothetical protein [Nitrospiraceae bacterium]
MQHESVKTMETHSLSDHLLSLDGHNTFPEITIEDMPNFQLSKKFLLDYFQDSITGHLVKGIVHNMNGFIQILSMQIELSKLDIEKDLEVTNASHSKELVAHLKKRKERLLEMEKVLAQVESTIDIVAYRGQNKENGQNLLSLDRVLKEELAFWNADLFFKHCVEKKTDLSATPSLSLVNENQLRDLIDSLLGACIEQMREEEEGSLKITLNQENDAAMWHLGFEHTGKAFPVAIDPPVAKDCILENPDNPLLILALKLAKVRAKQIGALLKIEPQKVSCLIPNTYTKMA